MADFVHYPELMEFRHASNWADFFAPTGLLLKMSSVRHDVVWARPQLIEWKSRLCSPTLWAVYALFLRACYAQACLTTHPACARCGAPTFGACRGILPTATGSTWCLTPVCSKCQLLFVGCPDCDPISAYGEGAHSPAGLVSRAVRRN